VGRQVGPCRPIAGFSRQRELKVSLTYNCRKARNESITVVLELTRPDLYQRDFAVLLASPGVIIGHVTVNRPT